MIKSLHFISLFVTILLVGVFHPAEAQNGVAIAATAATADASAMLDIQSTVKGALVPRMTTAQCNAISTPATGLLVFRTDVSPGFWYYNGTIWVQLSAGALSGTGTAGYDAAWTGSTALGNGNVYNSGTSVGIGTTGPNYKLDVAGSIGLANNNNTSTNKLYLSSADANHYIYSTGTGGNSMFFGEFGGIYNFYNTSTASTQVSFSAGAVSATGNINSGVGFTIGSAAASGNYLRGNGTNFVSAAIQAADIPTGSGNYIQNQTASAQSASFNISGSGSITTTLNIGTASTQGNIFFNTTPAGYLSWGSGGPYTKIYDNGNIHYWTDDLTNYESAATGTGATWQWVAGQNNTGTGGTTWMSLNNQLLTLTSLNGASSPAGDGNGPVYSNSNGTLYKQTGCPSPYTYVTKGIVALCIYNYTGATGYWNAQQAYCESQSGGSICTYNQAAFACDVASFTWAASTWLADRTGDDTYIYCNSGCSTNFDGPGTNRNTNYYALCCIQYIRF